MFVRKRIREEAMEALCVFVSDIDEKKFLGFRKKFEPNMDLSVFVQGFSDNERVIAVTKLK